MTTANNRQLTSSLGWSTADTLVTYGLDLPNEILGELDLGGMAFLGLMGHKPTPGVQRVFNALIVSLVEHGQTPSTIAARLTFLGAPEALQGAVAAGLSGLGSVFVGTMENAARLLQTTVAETSAYEPVSDVAERLVSTLRDKREIVPGMGHQKHRPVDPRSVKLFEIAREEGVYGRHCELMVALNLEVCRAYGKELPINAPGAVGAIASDLGLRWDIVRGLGVIGRSVGIVIHLLEELDNPIAKEIWNRIDDEVTEYQIAKLS